MQVFTLIFSLVKDLLAPLGLWAKGFFDGKRSAERKVDKQKLKQVEEVNEMRKDIDAMSDDELIDSVYSPRKDG